LTWDVFTNGNVLFQKGDILTGYVLTMGRFDWLPFKCVLCVRWQSNIPCLSEKTQFLGFLLRKVVQKHYICQVGKQSIVWFLSFFVTCLPEIIEIGSSVSRL